MNVLLLVIVSTFRVRNFRFPTPEEAVMGLSVDQFQWLLGLDVTL